MEIVIGSSILLLVILIGMVMIGVKAVDAAVFILNKDDLKRILTGERRLLFREMIDLIILRWKIKRGIASLEKEGGIPMSEVRERIKQRRKQRNKP